MSRARYSDDGDYWDLIKWRGQVTSAIAGRRGQSFLRELLVSLNELPEKKLCAHDLQTKDGACCALGAVGRHRGIDMTEMDNRDGELNDDLAAMFDIAKQMAREIQHENDEEGWSWHPEAKRDQDGRFVVTKDERGYTIHVYQTNADGEEVNKAGATKAEWEARDQERRFDRIARWAWEHCYWTEAKDSLPAAGEPISAMVERQGKEAMIHGIAQENGQIDGSKIVAWKSCAHIPPGSTGARAQ